MWKERRKKTENPETTTRICILAGVSPLPRRDVDAASFFTKSLLTSPRAWGIKGEFSLKTFLFPARARARFSPKTFGFLL